MRLFKNKEISTVEVLYQNQQFQYFRSRKKIINPCIDIVNTLKDCFREESVKVSCFFSRKKRNRHWRVRLKPEDHIFYQIASEMFLVKKSLEVLYAASFKDFKIVRLCLELTRHPWYQLVEKQHQDKKQNYNNGYLSRLTTSQQVAKRLYRIFRSYYTDLYCESIHDSANKKSKGHVRSPAGATYLYRKRLY